MAKVFLHWLFVIKDIHQTQNLREFTCFYTLQVAGGTEKSKDTVPLGLYKTYKARWMGWDERSSTGPPEYLSASTVVAP